jgi:hypothetical protein
MPARLVDDPVDLGTRIGRAWAALYCRVNAHPHGSPAQMNRPIETVSDPARSADADIVNEASPAALRQSTVFPGDTMRR